EECGGGCVVCACGARRGVSTRGGTLTRLAPAFLAAAPAVSFSGGGGSGASATATLAATNSCIAEWNVTGSCPGKKGQTISAIGLTGATGSGFSGTLSFGATNGDVTSISIQNPGNNFTTLPTNFSGLNGC